MCFRAVFLAHHEQPQAPPPVVHSARTVRNDVNVKRDSITFTPAAPGSKTCFLSFQFDAARPCTATVYFCAAESTNEYNVTTKSVAKRRVWRRGCLIPSLLLQWLTLLRRGLRLHQARTEAGRGRHDAARVL